MFSHLAEDIVANFSIRVACQLAFKTWVRRGKEKGLNDRTGDVQLDVLF